MSWEAFFVGEAGDTAGSGDYPEINEDATGVVFTTADGDSPQHLRATAIRVYDLDKPGKLKKRAWVEDVTIDCTITAQRFAFSCVKYDKGGGWYGGGAAILLDAASKIRAAVRRRGKCLVGHIPFSTVMQVGYMSQRRLLFSSEQVRFIVCENIEGTDFRIMVDFQLQKGLSAQFVAHDLAQRIAALRLAQHPALDATAREELETVARDGITKAPNADEFTNCRIPRPIRLREAYSDYAG